MLVKASTLLQYQRFSKTHSARST